MELENRRGARVPTVKALSTASSDQLRLPAPSAPLKRTIRFRVAFPSARFEPFFCIDFAGRRLRRVVCAERRARETETAPVEPAQLPVDHELAGEASTAGFASFLLPRPYDRLTWSTKPTQRFAFETVLAAVEVDATSIDYGMSFELNAARCARLHHIEQ